MNAFIFSKNVNVLNLNVKKFTFLSTERESERIHFCSERSEHCQNILRNVACSDHFKMHSLKKVLYLHKNNNIKSLRGPYIIILPIHYVIYYIIGQFTVMKRVNENLLYCIIVCATSRNGTAL